MIEFTGKSLARVDGKDLCYMDKKNIIFEMSNGCNMACKYCFEAEACERPVQNISFSTAREIIDKVFIEKGKEYKITFFGGEPLLNQEVLLQIIEYANNRAKDIGFYIKYFIVTNGTLFNQTVIDVFNANNVFVFFSYDGCQEIHDKYRVAKNGSFTYDKVTENIHTIARSRKRYLGNTNLAIRMTVTRDFLPKLKETYIKLIEEFPSLKIGFALVSAKESKEYAIKKQDLPLLRSVYLALADLYIREIENGESHNRFFESIVRNLFKGYRKEYFCSCGNKYIAVGNNGDIYPCEGFLGYKEFRLGNITDNCFESTMYKIESADENSSCKKCWARGLCGGSCYHECYMLNKDVNQKDSLMCETYKLAIEMGIRIYKYLIDNSLLDKFHEIIKEKLNDNAVPVLNSDNYKWIEDINTMFVLEENRYNILTLDEITVDILKLCDGKNTIKDIVTSLTKVYDADEQTIFYDINDILKDMQESSILYFTN